MAGLLQGARTRQHPRAGAAACPAPPKARPKSSAGRAPFPQGHAAGTARSSQVSDPSAPTGRPAPAVPGQPLHTPHTERIKEHSPRAPCRSAQARNGAAQRSVPRPVRRTHRQGGDGPPRTARRAGRRHSLRLPRGSRPQPQLCPPAKMAHTEIIEQNGALVSPVRLLKRGKRPGKIAVFEPQPGDILENARMAGALQGLLNPITCLCLRVPNTTAHQKIEPAKVAVRSGVPAAARLPEGALRLRDVAAVQRLHRLRVPSCPVFVHRNSALHTAKANGERSLPSVPPLCFSYFKPAPAPRLPLRWTRHIRW